MFQRILVALDRSTISETVFKEALAIAQKDCEAVMLVHVLSPFDDNYPASVYPTNDVVYPALIEAIAESRLAQWNAYEKESADYLQSLAQRALAAGVEVEFTQSFGDPGRVICAIARNWNADLIILGRQGRSGLNEMVLGSVSNYVVHHAPCSVLTLQGHLPPVDSPQETAESLATRRPS